MPIVLIRLALGFLRRAAVVLALVFAVFLTKLVLWPQIRLKLAEVGATEREQAECHAELDRAVEEIDATQESLDKATGQRADLVQDLFQLAEKIDQAKKRATDQLEQEIRDYEARIRQRDENRPSYFFSWKPIWERYWYDRATELMKKPLTSVDDTIDQLESKRHALAERLAAQEDQIQEYNRRLKEWASRRDELRNQFDLLIGKNVFIRETVRAWHQFVPWITWILLAIAVSPIAFKLALFYLVAPLATAQEPLLLGRSERDGVVWSQPVRLQSIKLLPDEFLFARSDWISQHDGAQKRTKLFWKMSACGVSFASKLVLCTMVRGNEDGRTSVTLSSSDVDTTITEIVLDEGEAVVHPRYIVAVQGPVSVRSIWRLRNPLAWLTCQFRYLAFSGSGSIFVATFGGVDAIFIDGGRQHLEQQLLVGFETRLFYGVKRTETFVPFWRGRAPLFEDCFSGTGAFFRRSVSSEGKAGVFERGASVVWEIVGKLLGF